MSNPARESARPSAERGHPPPDPPALLRGDGGRDGRTASGAQRGGGAAGSAAPAGAAGGARAFQPHAGGGADLPEGPCRAAGGGGALVVGRSVLDINAVPPILM